MLTSLGIISNVALESNMADSEVKRSIYLAQPKRHPLNTRKKHRLYEMLYDLNRGFTMTLESLDRLAKIGFFRQNYLRALHNMTDEIRARANYELAGTLRDHEQWEASQYGRLRLKWEGQAKQPAYEAGSVRNRARK